MTAHVGSSMQLMVSLSTADLLTDDDKSTSDRSAGVDHVFSNGDHVVLNVLYQLTLSQIMKVTNRMIA